MTTLQDHEDLKRDVRVKYTRNRRGVVRKQHQEVYLHEYVSCGVINCSKCVEMDGDEGCVREEHAENAVLRFLKTIDEADSSKILILDESVTQNQVDVMTLDPCPFSNAVFLLSAMNAIRVRHSPTYNKLRALSISKTNEKNTQKKLAYERQAFRDASEQLKDDSTTRGSFYVFPDCYFRQTAISKSAGETLHEYCARKAAVVTQWYCQHFGEESVMLLTQDEEGLNVARNFGLPATTVKSYLESIADACPLGIERYRETSSNISEPIEGLTEAEQDEEDGQNRKRRSDETGTIKFGKEIVGYDEDGVEIRKDAKRQYSAYWPEESVHAGLKNGTCAVGTIRMARGTSNYGFIQVNGLDDIRVENRLNINRALDGDVVVVELIGQAVSGAHADVAEEVDLDDKESSIQVLPERKSKRQKTGDGASDVDGMTSRAGRVVSIRKRADRSYIGSLRPLSDAQTIGSSTSTTIERVIIPSSRNLPYVVVRTRSSAMLEGMRLEFRIDGWPINSRYPRGHWTKVLGPCGNVNVESEVILHDHHAITRDFPDDVLRCLPPKGYTIPDHEAAKRVDLRKRNMPESRRNRFCCCSVDPPGCKDIDDALSCEFLEDGTIELGVHIADVTHFVKPDSALDKEAAQRCTTVYLVDRRTDMLPGLLTTDLCSLVGKADRLAFSVVWHLDVNGNEISTPKFHKSVICSDGAFTYLEAQTIIDDQLNQTGVAKALRQLMSVSKIYRQKRMDNGAVEMNNIETKFNVDQETGEVEGCQIYPMYDTNRMIEEFMLLANITVSKKIFSVYPSHSVLRRHPPPQTKALEELKNDLMHYRGIDFRFANSTELSNSLKSAKDPSDEFFQTLVSMQVLRCMNAAVYFCSGDSPEYGDSDIPDNFWHYGLAIPIYTHFTSPIRRYADVLVHRLLAAALKMESRPDQLQSKDGLVEQAKLMSQKHRDAQWASRSSGDFAAFKFFKKLETHPNEAQFPTTVEAAVTDVREGGLSVIIKRYGLERSMTFPQGTTEFDQTEKALTSNLWEGGIRKYDNIIVKMKPTSADFRFRVDVEFIRRKL